MGKESLGTELKFALRRLYGEPVNTTLILSNIDSLRGLEAAGVAEARKLIEAIEKYGRIEVKETW